MQEVAKKLDQLPCIFDAFVEGGLSWDKLVLVCIFATAETDMQFATTTPELNMRQLRKLARRAQELKEDASADDADHQYMKFRVSRDGRFMRISTFLAIENGVVVRKCIEAASDGYGPEENGLYLDADQQNARALVEICSAQLGGGEGSHSTSVIIEGDVSILNGEGTADIERDGVLSPTAVRRLLCSSSVELSITNGNKTIGSGRATRLFPPKVIQALMRRDQGCRFPGCQRRRWLHGHHIKWWCRDLGESNEDNGIMLCDHHHMFVHEKQWRIVGDVYGELEFIRPDGRAFTGRAPAPRPDVIERSPLRKAS